jgi:hypothetical protein
MSDEVFDQIRWLPQPSESSRRKSQCGNASGFWRSIAAGKELRWSIEGGTLVGRSSRTIGARASIRDPRNKGMDPASAVQRMKDPAIAALDTILASDVEQSAAAIFGTQNPTKEQVSVVAQALDNVEDVKMDNESEILDGLTDRGALAVLAAGHKRFKSGEKIVREMDAGIMAMAADTQDSRFADLERRAKAGDKEAEAEGR